MKPSIRKIMVVDDSPTDLAFLESVLTKGGFQVTAVASGEAAIARSAAEQPDLILMDLVMPGVNGFQATRAITRAAATLHIPVVICSSKDQDTDKIWGMRQGATAYLTKPVVESELMAAISAASKRTG